MDPYRPNQYGFRPPPPVIGSFGQPPPQRYPAPVRPPAYGGQYNMVYRPPPNQSVPENTDKLNTLFVGAIAPGISDEWIEKLLQVCGTLKQWKRVKDSAGNPKGFGFATYEDPDSSLCALRVIGGEKTAGVTLKAADNSQIEKKLIVKADDNVRSYLENYQQSSKQTTDEEDQADDRQKYQLVQKYMTAINKGFLPGDADGAFDIQEIGQQEEHQDSLARDLAMFKERAVQKDQEKRKEPERRRKSSPDRRRDFVKGAVDEKELMMTDEEMERRRREKHERDVENAYRHREKRFENRENAQLREYEKDLKREIEEEERLVKDRAYWLERLADWDDELEMEKGEELYYSDRSRWRKMRESVRRRDHERDEEDKRRELQEIEDEKRRLEEEERIRKESKILNREGDDRKIAVKTTKLNFNISMKRNTLGGVDEEDEEENRKKRRVLVPLDYSDIEKRHYSDEEEMTTEERTALVKKLIDSIPSSQNELWSYRVRWEELDENLIEQKLRPFVSKKIFELLGMEEEDLVNFVLKFIREKKGPDELVSELEGALEEDALVFVMKLWRALIFELERKKKRL
ncbi:hypothetical protein G6F60_004353 [Rhizopus arrhizus]|nr:hypothetical protein G6F61_003780 [Rhizopus arrhizus]KAG1404425.1 hypothetical protein G6F60_004353 [Rhizopus arrhizus]